VKSSYESNVTAFYTVANMSRVRYIFRFRPTLTTNLSCLMYIRSVNQPDQNK